MNPNSHTADALREILATCADPLNRACEEYAKLARELAEAQDIAAELITERARRSFEDRMSAASETRRTSDTARMDWLALQWVEVRTPLVYGSRHDFTARPVEQDGHDEPSDIRAQIDARIKDETIQPQPESAPCVVSEDSDELRGENVVLRDRIAELDAELARIRAAFGVATNDAVIVKAHELEEGPLASAPCNVEGPAHLCPKPAPGFELDKRGVLVATDRGPSAPCVARPSEETVKLAKSVMRHVGDISHLTSGMAAECLAREILRLDERNGDK